MARHNLSALIRYLRQLTGSAQGDGASDAELLERYVRHRDDAAFELLLWRHGALVFNVCRRILPREQDAEDAFQATFLAFVRKAGSISRRGSVSAWLHKVAYRIALAAKARTQKTAAREKPNSEALAAAAAPESTSAELLPILDEELNRLPERLRRPIVLCYLEGKTNEEAARQLGCPAGTIFSRLARGREMLRRRLQRRGVTLSVGALTAALTGHAVEAMPAAALLSSTLRSALLFAVRQTSSGVSAPSAALAEGVLRTMFVTKLKLTALMVLVIGIAAGGVFTYGRTAAPQVEAKAEDPPSKPAGGDKKAAEPIAVKVVKPKKGGLPRTIVIWGGIDVSQRQQLFPLASGTIKEVAVDIGDPVKKGQVVIALSAPLLVKDVEQAEAALEMALAQREEAKSAVLVVQSDPAPNAKRAKLDRARASLKAAEANVKLAKVALEKAQIQEEFTRLRAEFDGVVAELNCDPGNIVQSGASGTRKPLLTLVRVDRLRVSVELGPYFASVAERGDPVELSVEGINRINSGIDPDPPGVLAGDTKAFIAGKIARISPIADRPGGKRTAIIEVPNPKNRLVPGETIGVRILFNKTRNLDAFTMPQSCVRGQPNKNFVYVVRDGKAHMRKVKLGNFLDDKCDVIEGIQANDVIIVKPGDFKDGTPVKIDKMP